MNVLTPVPVFNLDGSPMGRQHEGDNFTLFIGDDGLIDLVVEGDALTLDDLAQLKMTLDSVLGGAS